MQNDKESIFIIDLMGLIHTNYRARPKYSMNSHGQDTQAIDATISGLNSILEEHNPKHLAIACDPLVKSFRNEIYPQYKGNRSERDPLFVEQIPAIIEILRKLGFPIFCVPGYEADDVIGTIAKHFSKLGHPVKIHSKDKDFIQLIDQNISLLSDEKILTIKNGHEKFGVPIEYSIDFLALTGDRADNIPGVESIGENSAKLLINAYGGIDQIYESIDNSTFNTATTLHNIEKAREVLKKNRDIAYISYKLAKIKTDVELGDLSLDKLTIQAINAEEIVNFFKQWEIPKTFNIIIKNNSSFFNYNPELKQQLIEYVQTHPFKESKLQQIEKPKKTEPKKESNNVSLFAKKSKKKTKHIEINNEQYQLTNDDQELQRSYAPLEGDFELFLEKSQVHQLADLNEYLKNPEITTIPQIVIQQIVDQVENKSTSKLSLVQNLDKEQQALTCTEIQLEELFAASNKDIFDKVTRWINALLPTCKKIKELIPYTISVGINFELAKDNTSLFIGISLLHHNNNQIQDLVIPLNYTELTNQDLATSCFTWQVTHNKWENHQLDNQDFIAFVHVLRELLIKPLFYAQTTPNLFANLQNNTQHPLELLDANLNLTCNEHIQIFVKELLPLLTSLDFSIEQAAFIGNHVHDISVVGYCRNNNYKNEFEKMTQELMNINLDSPDKKDKSKSVDKFKNYEKVCKLIPTMGLMFSSTLNQPFYRDIEQPLYKALYHMQCCGMPYNSQKIKIAIENLERELQKYENEIFNIAGTQFNLSNKKYLKIIKNLGIDIKNLQENTLINNLNEPIINLIYKYDKLAKIIKNTKMIFPQAISPHSNLGYLSLKFSQTNNVNGELHHEPNLLDLLKLKDFTESIRQSFTSDSNYSLVSFTYNNLMPTIIAHLTQDEDLVKSINDGRDIYKLIAVQIFGHDYDNITPQHYDLAKAITDLIGTNTDEISKHLKANNNLVTRCKKEFFKAFPQLKNYIDKTFIKAQTTQFIKTTHGRLITLPNINSGDKFVLKYYKRLVYQILFHDYFYTIIKTSMINIHQAILREMPEVIPHLTTQNGYVFSIPTDLVAYYARKIQKIMEYNVQHLNFKVPVTYQTDSFNLY